MNHKSVSLLLISIFFIKLQGITVYNELDVQVLISSKSRKKVYVCEKNEKTLINDFADLSDLNIRIYGLTETFFTGNILKGNTLSVLSEGKSIYLRSSNVINGTTRGTQYFIPFLETN